MAGKIIFRYGTMGSAKSAHLLMTGYNFEEHDRKVLYIKPSIDTRDGEAIYSRIGLNKACSIVHEDEQITDIFHRELSECHRNCIILIDECQFLSASQVDELADIADEFGALIICYGLRTDSNSNLFPGSKRLFEIADTFEEVKSTCDCGKKTVINARYNEKGYILSNNQIDIGGNDKYKAVCRSCWKKELIKDS